MRICYQCKKEIEDKEGKYFCSRVCWDKYGETYPSPTKTTSLKKMQERLLQMAKEARENKPDIIKTAEKIFEITQ